MLKVIFEYLTDSYSLLENPVQDMIVMAILGYLAYLIAYRVVGNLYHGGIIDGSGEGKIFHWIIRFVVLTAFVAVCTIAIRVRVWFVGLPDIKWWIIGGIAAVVISLYVFYQVHEHLEYAKVRENRNNKEQ